MRRQNRAVKVIRVRRTFDNPEKQADFEQTLYTTGHWAKCPDCGTPKYVVPGFVDTCPECSRKEPNHGV